MGSKVKTVAERDKMAGWKSFIHTDFSDPVKKARLYKLIGLCMAYVLAAILVVYAFVELAGLPGIVFVGVMVELFIFGSIFSK